MFDNEVLNGRAGRRDRPLWAPLEALLPDVLCARFMWMSAVELDDGRDLQAYKHADTRRHLLLDDDGVAYERLDRDSYRRMRTADALEAAFGMWWLLEIAEDDERAAVRAALVAASEADAATGRDRLPPSSPASCFRRLPSLQPPRSVRTEALLANLPAVARRARGPAGRGAYAPRDTCE